MKSDSSFLYANYNEFFVLSDFFCNPTVYSRQSFHSLHFRRSAPPKLLILHNLKSGGKLPMARGNGIHRTSARNARMKDADIGNAQAHNEREKSSYVNQDIVPERTQYSVHFKTPTAGYKEMFEQMRSDDAISTRGLKADAEKFGELIFDVNSAYFFNHGGYEFAKQ